MAIKGLTDKDSSFPKIGTLRKGAKKGEKTIGKDLTYFRFDSKDDRAITDFKAVYGEQPTEINLFLPHPSTDENFFTCKEEWAAGGLKHRCDGETCTALQVGGRIQRHFIKPEPCPGGCKEVGRLNIIVPELRRFAYISVETHSINDIVNLHQQLQAVETTFGHLNSIPFVLRRRPEQISTPKADGSRARHEKWMLSIEVSPDWANLRIEYMQSNALQQARNAGAIASAPNHRSLPPASIPRQIQPVAVEPAQPYTPYRDTKAWIAFTGMCARAVDMEQLNAARNWALKKIEAGDLPSPASAGIDRELEIAIERFSQDFISVGAEQVEDEF